MVFLSHFMQVFAHIDIGRDHILPHPCTRLY